MCACPRQLALLMPLLLVLCRPACAGQMRLTASGQWEANAVASLQSGPGAPFAFQFALPAALPPGPLTGSDFVYSLGQINRPLGLAELVLEPAAAGGMFDMTLSDGANLSLFGPVLAPAGQLSAGQFGFVVLLGGQIGTGVATVAPVPEPPTRALLLPPLLWLGWVAGRRMRTS